MPVYNGEEYLRAALQSLVEQDYANLRIIISDNASTDSTPQICREFAARDERITYHRSEVNRGAVWNFAEVFSRSSGEYFMWAADDDLWHPEFISKCVSVLEADPTAVVCHSHGQPITPDGRPLGSPYVDWVNESPSLRQRWVRILKDWHLHAAIYGLIRRDSLARTRLLLPRLSCDLILMAELSVHGKIVQVPEVLQWKRVPEFAEYRTPEEMLELLGAPRTDPGQLHRARTFAACIEGMREICVDRRIRILLTTEAIRTYLQYGFWIRDLAGLLRSPLSRLQKSLSN